MSAYVDCITGKGKRRKEERIAEAVCAGRQGLGFKCAEGCQHFGKIRTPQAEEPKKEGCGMDIRIDKISLRNFKGIRELDVTIGDSTTVYGDNATGKTTIEDGFLWCLFGKDSANRTDFEIKPLDSTGEAAHNLEHSVEVFMRAGSSPVVLKKVYSETWTKKRGSATKTFTGHTVDHFFNGVPVKEKEFKERIKTLFDEGVFRLVTDPRFFNEHLPWQDRRKTLLAICGDVTNDQVISSSDKLAGLRALLNGNNIEDLRKILAARRTEINRELEKIPTRIDEVTKSIVPVRDDIAQVPAMMEDLWKKKEELAAQLTDLNNGGALSAKRVELQNIQAEIQAARNAFEEGKNSRLGPIRAEQNSIHAEWLNVSGKAQTLASEISTHQADIDAYERELPALRDKWAEIDAQEISVTTHCPTCGHDIPEIQVEEARQKFLNAKAEKLAGITARGKERASKIDEYTASIAEAEKTLAGIRLQLSALDGRKAGLQEQIQAILAEQPDLSALEGRRASVQADIDNISSSIQGLAQGLKDQIQAVATETEALHAELRKAEANKAAHKRIEELSAQEKALAEEYETLEGSLFLTEEFVRAKVGLLESRINTRFALARFKMFENQINGGLSEVCETTLNGVPYSSINNAGRIQVGMDIIRTLQQHYGITAPVWVDNRESVVRLPDMPGQIISLVVSEADKTLRVA